jgi:enoyl-[acyl-carrier-protein] reductase (NADH)/acyl carrier protein
VILADQQGIGQSLAQTLQNQGQAVVLVYADEITVQLETGVWRLNPTQDDTFEQLFQAIGNSIQALVHLWSLDAPPPSQLTAENLARSQGRSSCSIPALIQALSRTSLTPRLWLVTQGAQPVGAEHQNQNLAIAQAPLWGVGRVVALEHPELWGGMVDLDPQVLPETSAQHLLQILQADLGEDHWAYRQQQAYGARLVPYHPISQHPLPIQADATYWITGGVGALGLYVSQWLVQQGAKYLVLSSRRGNRADMQAAIAQLEQHGATVVVLAADVTQSEDIAQVLTHIQNTLPPLRGIIHAAGVVDQQTLVDLDGDRFLQVLQPKLRGTWLLHEFTHNLKLDFWIGFSSIAAVWGSKGQAHYAAANHFLDAFAHYQQGLGLPTLSVNWGPWAGGGMATPDAETWLTGSGLNLLQPQSAVESLGQLLTAGVAQAVVADMDWPRFKALYEVRGARSLLAAILPSPLVPADTPTSVPQAKPPRLRQHLETMSPNQRREQLVTSLRQEVAQVLGLGTQLPAVEQGFFDMGMDSLMAVDLRNRLETGLGTSLPATLAFEYPTVTALASFLARSALNWDTEANFSALEADKPETHQTDLLETVEHLSESEVEASITQELAELEALLREG